MDTINDVVLFEFGSLNMKKADDQPIWFRIVEHAIGDGELQIYDFTVVPFIAEPSLKTLGRMS